LRELVALNARARPGFQTQRGLSTDYVDHVVFANYLVMYKSARIFICGVSLPQNELQQPGGGVSTSELALVNFIFIRNSREGFIKHLVENVMSPIQLISGARIIDLH
jgi:hypothetical protein